MSHDDRATLRDTLLMVAAILLVAALAASAMRWLPGRTWRSPFAARTTSAANACVNNLRQIDGAKEQWALEHQKTNGVPVPAAALVLYLRGNALPVCPNGGRYTIGNSGSPPACSVGGAGHTL